MADKGANLNCTNSQNVHPIFYAINNGKQLSTEYLIFRAQDLNIEDNECQSLLVNLLFTGNYYLARRVIHLGGDINYVNTNG